MTEKRYSHLIGNQHARGAKPNKTAFKKGIIPWNKNKKGIHLSPETEFKKGRVSLNKKPLGTITQREDKNGKFRNFIKTGNPNTWTEHARHVWEKNYGPLIKGDVVHHLDGNTINDSPKNLIALPRKDHPIFHNKWWLKQPTKEQKDFYLWRYKKNNVQQNN